MSARSKRKPRKVWATWPPVWQRFRQARAFVRELGLSSWAEWDSYKRGALRQTHGMKPEDIPCTPNKVYSDEWGGMGDWLGTGKISTNRGRRFRSFTEARDFARGLNLRSSTEWRTYVAGDLRRTKGLRPGDVPSLPDKVYKKEFKGYGDWLGTGRVANKDLVFRPFREARAFVRALRLHGAEEWRRYSKGELKRTHGLKPADIPAGPNVTYEDEWKGMGDWLGTGRIANQDRVFRPFREARAFVRALNLTGTTQWQRWRKGEMPEKGPCPPDIPSVPARAYRNKGWIGFGDWLGTGTEATWLRVYRPFDEARAFVRSLGLSGKSEWERFRAGRLPKMKGRLPKDIPSTPDRTYRKQWQSWGDWLGTGTIAPKDRRYRPFDEARAFARALGLKSTTEWYAWSRGDLPKKGRRPLDIPSAPWMVYREKGWAGYGDWLGTGTIAPSHREYRPFKEARAFTRGLGLGTIGEWRDYCQGKCPGKPKKPDDIPSNPPKRYSGQGWAGWSDWLNARIMRHPGRFRPFAEARDFARSLCLKSSTEWRLYCLGKMPGKGWRPAGIPSNPQMAYHGQGWTGYGDWLGTGVEATFNRRYRSFAKARAFARSLGLDGEQDWRDYASRKSGGPGLPADIPAAPAALYKGSGWEGWGDFLGTGRKRRFNGEYRPFEEARVFARSLRLRGYTEWHEYCDGRIPKKTQRPQDIPASPESVYKDAGWDGWGDFLGTGRRTHLIGPYCSFAKAREFARSLGLASGTEWRRHCAEKDPHKGERPAEVPSNPEIVYAKKGWLGWADFLGTGRKRTLRGPFRPYEEARAFAKTLGLKNVKEWFRYCGDHDPYLGERPMDIPSSPTDAYANAGWVSWGDFLGTGRRRASPGSYRPYDQACRFVRRLGLRSWGQWKDYCGGRLPHLPARPLDIPAHPDDAYKDKGWSGWTAFFAKNR